MSLTAAAAADPESFTGIRWQHRPTEQIVADLTTGRGAVVTAELAVAWRQVAQTLRDRAVTAQRLARDATAHWDAEAATDTAAAMQRLAQWLQQAAEAADDTATRAKHQSEALVVAQIAAPHPAEVAVTKAATTALDQAARLIAPLHATKLITDVVEHDQRRRAVAAMVAYESSSLPQAQPWLALPPPPTPAAPAASPPTGTAAAVSPAAGLSGSPVGAVPLAASPIAAPHGRYAVTNVAAVATEKASRPVSAAVPTTSVTSTAGPLAAPLGAIPSAGREPLTALRLQSEPIEAEKSSIPPVFGGAR